MSGPPSLAVEHYRRQQRLVRRLLLRARIEWDHLPALTGEAWAESVGPRLVTLTTAAQLAAVMQSVDFTNAMARYQGIDAEPEGKANPRALAGVASDGRPLESLLYQAVPAAKAAPTGGGKAAGWRFLNEALMTQTADAARAGSGITIASNSDVQGYIRVPGPGACSRCAILAGRFYRWNADFDRHPHCMCGQAPVGSSKAKSWRSDPRQLFDRLSRDEQDRRYTKAGAEAIRDGADMSQVVNARAGMSTARAALRGPGDRWTASGRAKRVDVFGQKLLTTTEGTTKRGIARNARGKDGIRLMPESIYQIAQSREDAIRLLKLYGFIL